MIFQSTTAIKNKKNIRFGKGFCHFLISAPAQHLFATHGLFHRHQFLTVNYFFYSARFELFSGGHGRLATL